MTAGGYLLKDGTTTTAFKPANIAKYVLDKDGNPRTNVPYYDLTSNNNNIERDYSKYIFVSTALSSLPTVFSWHLSSRADGGRTSKASFGYSPGNIH